MENPVRYLMTTFGDGSTPTEQQFKEMDKFIAELSASGVLLAAGGLESGGVHVTSVASEFTVTDGPFAEAKEAAGGFALVEVNSREEAIELARRAAAIGGDGRTIIQQVFG
ncbi:MAG: YciI family protein [Actinophytocola sp.]|uniref:YciI family protein n=1 Tax=Actinophytocola sp. TaxID=1872138 RepID=UPI003C71CDE3